jgi:hypothetical protein
MSSALKLAWRRFKRAIKVKRVITLVVRAAVAPAKPAPCAVTPLAQSNGTTERPTILARVAQAASRVTRELVTLARHTLRGAMA